MKLRLLPIAALALPALLAAAVPAGFTPLFNGKDLAGWHISPVSHHGTSTGWSVRDGVVLATQDRPGNGGILLTDRKYRDFEVSLDINPDFGCDGGLFLRSNEDIDGSTLGRARDVATRWRDGATAAVGSRRRHCPSTRASAQACASDWRTIM